MPEKFGVKRGVSPKGDDVRVPVGVCNKRVWGY